MNRADKNVRLGLALLFLLVTPAMADSNDGRAEVDMVKRGEYLALLGDCAACHTAHGGEPMAGGLDMATPFGIIYSTNITPDRETGIGAYSFEQFDRAVRKGKAVNGDNLYPVMPYLSFSRINQQDMRALYAYFMHGVAPARQPPRKNEMQWPFSMRFGLSLWNMVFADDQEFRPDPGKSERWNRGAYLVQGLGHCGACHTPRGVAFQEKAADQTGSSGMHFLDGSTIDSWHAPSLRHLWPESEIAQFLKTGRNSHAAAFGSMTEVVHFSTQRFAEDDLASIAEYLRSLSAPVSMSADNQGAAKKIATQSQDFYKSRGGLGYVQFCSACHQLDGRGVEEFFPPLAGNESVLTKDPTSVLHVVLTGWRSAKTQRYPRAFGMPSYSTLSDQEIAEIVTFVRKSWGNFGEPVSAEQVGEMRRDIKLRPSDPAPFATPRFSAMLDSPNADQLIRGMRILTETKVLLPGNVGASLSCSSCHFNGGTVAKGAPYAGVSALFPVYRPRAGKVIEFKDRVNACFRRSMNGKPLEKNSSDMLALVAYADWLKVDSKPGEPIPGRGVGKIESDIRPDVKNGREVYKGQCAICHGDKGEGLKRADGFQVFPPLSGDATFNIGAGMARTYTAAAFVKNNMPIANNLKFPLGQGGLSDQDAVDVAAYFTHLPRPDFPDKVKDWPKGGKPKDARY